MVIKPRSDAERARKRALYAEKLRDPYLARRLKRQRRQDYLRMRADPVRLAARRRYKAEWQRNHVSTPAEKLRAKEYRRARRVRLGLALVAPTASRGSDIRTLPVAPFRRWLVAYMAQAHLEGGPAVAADLGIHERRVTSLLISSQVKVSIDVVDRALINAQGVVCLDDRMVFGVDDLYPELLHQAA